MNRRRFLAALATTGTAGCTGLDGGGRATTTPPESFSAQIEFVREATAKYKGHEGIDTALDDGFRPFGRLWDRFILRTDPPPRPDLTLTNITGLIYLVDNIENPPRLGGVIYSVPAESHGEYDHEPPDLFNDEEQDLQLSEEEGWRQYHRHPIGTFVNGFSNQNGSVDDDITAVPHEQLFNRKNWLMFIGKKRDKAEQGKQLDVDDDGEKEILDYVFKQRTGWDNTVWVHLDNAKGVFAAKFESNR